MIIEYLEKELDINEKKANFHTTNDERDHNDEIYLNCNPKCEPNLGKRGLYQKFHNKELKINDTAILWILNYSDGNNSLRKISELSGIKHEIIKEIATLLEKEKLLKLIDKN